MTLGLGMIIGNLINGVVTRRYTVTSMTDGLETTTHNWQAIWLIPAVMAVAVVGLFALTFADRTATKNEIKEA